MDAHARTHIVTKHKRQGNTRLEKMAEGGRDRWMKEKVGERQKKEERMEEVKIGMLCLQHRQDDAHDSRHKPSLKSKKVSKRTNKPHFPYYHDQVCIHLTWHR